MFRAKGKIVRLMNIMFGHRELPANELSLHDHFTIRDGIDGLIRHVPKKPGKNISV